MKININSPPNTEVNHSEKSTVYLHSKCLCFVVKIINNYKINVTPPLLITSTQDVNIYIR